MDPLLPPLYLLQLDPSDILLQLLRLMDILLRKLYYRVHYIVVLLGDEHEDVIQVFGPKDVIILFKGVLDYFDNLQDQWLRTELADCTVDLFLDVCRYVCGKASVNVQQDPRYFIGIFKTGYIGFDLVDQFGVGGKVTADIVQEIYIEVLKVVLASAVENIFQVVTANTNDS